MLAFRRLFDRFSVPYYSQRAKLFFKDKRKITILKLTNFNLFVLNCASLHIILFPDRSLITTCFVYLYNLCNVNINYAVTLVTFSEHRRNGETVHRPQTHRNSVCNLNSSMANSSALLSSGSLLESFHTQIDWINLLSKA